MGEGRARKAAKTQRPDGAADGRGGFRKATRTWNQVIPLNRT
jgi:hypothetical protein